jgi:hypothetical protein
MPETVKEEQNKEVKETTAQEEFDAAWNENEPKEKDSEVPPVPPVPKADEGKDTETQPGSEPKEDPVPPPKKETDAPKVEDLLSELERERQKTRSWNGRIQAANKRAKELEEELLKLKEGQAKTKEETPKETPAADKEEDEALTSFKNDFPDLPKPIIALVKREILPMVRDLIKAELSKVGAVAEEVKSIKEKIEVDTEAEHYALITKAHPEWREIVSSGDLDKFIESQPSYVRKALEQVRDEGVTEEVIDMFSQYKAWKNPTKPNETKPKEEQNIDDVADEIAVPANPGGPKIPKAKNKDDFDSAWDEAIKTG